MRALLRTGMLVLVVFLGLSGLSFAKQVILKDGSILECESFWKRQGQVVVKVNRDVVLEFAPEEVDLRRTFAPRAKVRKPKHPAKKRAASPAASVSQVPGALSTAAARREDAKPAQPSAPPQPKETAPAPGGPAAAPGKAAAAPGKAAAATGKAAPAAGKAAAATGKAAAAPVETAPASGGPEAAPEPGPAAGKVEFERRAKENAERMAEAIKKHDPALLKQALEAQQSLALQQKGAGKGGLHNAPGSALPKPGSSWFTYLLVLACCVLLIIVAMWVVFEKAGESGWKSLIPFYNIYILMEISGKPGWWFILLCVPVVGVAINLLAMLSLSEKFGRGPAFGVGLLLLPMIFFPLLAFGGSQYQYAVPAPEMDFSFSEEL